MLKKSELAVLNSIVECGGRHSVYSLAAEIKKPQSTVFNLVKKLANAGYLSFDTEMSIKKVPKKIIVLTELGFCAYILHSSRFDEAAGSLTKKVAIIRGLRGINFCTEGLYHGLRLILSSSFSETEYKKKGSLINSLVYVQSRACGQTFYRHLANVRSDKYSEYNSETGKYVIVSDSSAAVHEMLVTSLFETFMQEFPLSSEDSSVAEVGSAMFKWFAESDEKSLISQWLYDSAAFGSYISLLQREFDKS